MGDGMSSRTPDGGYMPTFASNFMLDGFAFSEEYGEGPLVNNKNTTTSRTTGMAPAARSESGMAKLPDGIVTAEEESRDEMGWDVFAGGPNSDVGDLSELVKTANHITDLSWLEVVEQDPDRLPHHHNDAVIQGLVDAWGTRTRTDGVGLVPNVVVPPQPRSPVALLPGDQYREVVASAMRKSAFGAPFENIVAGVAAHLGEAMAHVHTDPRLQKLAHALRSVKAEHGVVGRVYVRDSAFPGLLTGKWDKEIKKRCASACYWLTKPGSKLAAYQNYLGKKVVTEIPWSEALAHYRPTLEASGRKLASGDPRRALLAALAAEPAKVAHETAHTYNLAPADQVSIKEAWQVFASAPAPIREVVSKPAQGLTQEQAAGHFARWVRAGLLPVKTARHILASGHTPDYKVGYGAWVIESGRKAASYDGTGVGKKIPMHLATQTAEWAKQESLRVASVMADRAYRSARAKVSTLFQGWVRLGAINPKVASALLASKASNEDLLILGTTLAERIPPKAKYAGEGVGVKTPVRATQDGSRAVLEQAEMDRALEARARLASHQKVASAFKKWTSAGLITQEQASAILSTKAPADELIRAGARLAASPKKASYHGVGEGASVHVSHPETFSVADTRPVIRYIQAAMNEGAAGDNLDVLLASKFSQDYLKKAEAPLVQIRRKHEGLAGHLYVDASAYASPTGTSGCDKGAAKHRANQIKAVLQMDRCGSCSQNTEGNCQKYGKVLVASAPVRDPEKYQREAIRLANADDSERTASMFANYNPEEFDLQNDSLDSFDYSNIPGNEPIAGIVFGGMIIPEE